MALDHSDYRNFVWRFKELFICAVAVAGAVVSGQIATREVIV
jgi:hypothetical protein